MVSSDMLDLTASCCYASWDHDRLSGGLHAITVYVPVAQIQVDAYMYPLRKCRCTQSLAVSLQQLNRQRRKRQRHTFLYRCTHAHLDYTTLCA